MKLVKRLFISAMTALIALASAFPLTVNAAPKVSDFYLSSSVMGDEQYIEIPEDIPFLPESSPEAAADFMRSCMRRRDDFFKIEIPADSFPDIEDAVKYMLALAFEETGSGSDGDYLRYGIKRYDYLPIDYGDVYSIIYKLTYLSDSQQEAVVTEKVPEIFESLGIYGKTEYEKVRAIYNFVAASAEYADDVTDNTIFTAYGALVNGSAVCQGYSLLLYRLLMDSGISCRIISGTSRGVRHTWNIAKVGACYYLLDVTWDSAIGDSAGHYFLKGTSDFDSFQLRSKHIAVYEYPIIYPDYTSAEFSNAFPIAETSFPAPEYTKGDVNGDRIIDAKDASAVLTAYAIVSVGRKDPFTEKQNSAAEVNGDGITDAKDASFLLSYYAAASVGKADSLDEFLMNRR